MKLLHLLSLLACCAGVLGAGQAVPLSVAQLTTHAELILQGKVVSQTCQRDAAGRIYTRVILDVTEVWKGTLATNRFTLVHGGGVLGEERVTVSGQTAYHIGEEVVAFLVLNARSEGVSLCLAQGKFTITRDAVTGATLANHAFHNGANASPPRARSTPMTTVPNPPAPLSLSELKRQVQALLQ